MLLKKKRVRLKEKAPLNVIAGCGERKACLRVADLFDSYWDVLVVRYEGKDYFVVKRNGKVKECMPL